MAAVEEPCILHEDDHELLVVWNKLIDSSPKPGVLRFERHMKTFTPTEYKLWRSHGMPTDDSTFVGIL